MAENLFSLVRELVNRVRDLSNDVADATEELESFQEFIDEADKVAEAEEDNNRRDGIKSSVKQLREATFRIKDIIDEYMIFCEERQPDDPRCVALLCEAVDYIKTHIFRLQIAFKIQVVMSLARAERRDFQRQFPLDQRPNSSTGNQNVTRHNLRMASRFIEEDEVVGFEGPTEKLIGWLIEGRPERTVISVVGMAGVGKTTLAKQVFDNKKVVAHFECHAWITVSQSYTVEELMRNMLQMFYREKMEATHRDISTMDQLSLVNELRNYLQKKRYVVLFDDVWNPQFWDEIKFSVIDNKNGSRILITTRNKDVAEFCRRSSFIRVHELQPLSDEKSFELFCQKAFQYDFDGYCPSELKDVCHEIVRKCHGLPLAIVSIGGLLSSKERIALQWKMFSENLSKEMEKNLIGVSKILSLSYDDLPYNLKSCLLYLGMYPEDYEVKSDRLIRQWIAEGFVKHERDKILVEVAQEYLAELIRRNLVQVSLFSIDGKFKRCRVHGSLHNMILRKIKDTGFSQYIDEHDQILLSGMFRRLTIAMGSNDLMESIERSRIRSILIITDKRLSEHFISRILAEQMPLKVLDFEGARLYHVPENLGNLIHLKYLSFRNTQVQSLPKSIGKLQNLETLDVRQTRVFELPMEISKLRKLQHLLADFISSIQLKDSLGGMTSLQKIPSLRMDDDGVVIRELEKLKQLRGLSITNFKGHHGSTLSSSINEMKLLEKLHIDTIDNNEVIDLHFMSSRSALRKLCLNGNLNRLPDWIPRLQHLVKLSLLCSYLTTDPLDSLKDMPSLLFLSISHRAYEGKILHFQDGGFIKLKELELKYLYKLNSVVIDRGALHSLAKLQLSEIPQLKEVPSGIQHLRNLEVLDIWIMPTEFEQSIAQNGGKEHPIIRHVPRVRIISRVGAEVLEILHRTETTKRPTLEMKGVFSFLFLWNDILGHYSFP
ncbi:Disease resistance protein RPM1 isoform B [Glycine soja]|uniref:Disease resistance protein RPM1 isoform B n=1 Tax=Glycine soja TaxID=3848 RepID=A0A445FQP5_GLYSO|nr:Disease resistance protein RPM1 isoform B [Glycine soja]